MNRTSKIFFGSCTEALQVSGSQAGIHIQYSIYWLWHAAVSDEQVHDADKKTAAASRCCGFLARAQSHVQLSGRYCIGIRCGPSLTAYRERRFSVWGMLTQGRRTECISHWKCGCGWSWIWSWLVDWPGRHSPLYSDFEYMRHKKLSINCFVSTAFLTWLVSTTWLISLQLHFIKSFLPW